MLEFQGIRRVSPRAEQAAKERKTKDVAAKNKQFKKQRIAVKGFEPFYFVPMESERSDTATVGPFMATGPALSAAKPVRSAADLHEVVAVGSRLFGITIHDFGEIVAGKFKKIPCPKKIDPSWLTGIAFNPKTRTILVLGRTSPAIYNVDDGSWKSQGEMKNVLDITFDAPTNSYVALSTGDSLSESVTEIKRFNANLAFTKKTLLKEPIFIGSFTARRLLQTHASGDKLYVVQDFAESSGGSTQTRYMTIDLKTGQIFDSNLAH